MDFTKFEIGSNIGVKTISNIEYVGQYCGYSTTSNSVILSSVHCDNPDSIQLITNSENLLINCDLISEVRHVETKLSNSSPKDTNEQQLQLATKHTVDFDWIPGNKAKFNTNSQAHLQVGMKDFCKKLFGSAKFVNLIMHKAQSDQKKFNINIPSYFAMFFRQPSLFEEPKISEIENSFALTRQTEREKLQSAAVDSLVDGIEALTLSTSSKQFTELDENPTENSLVRSENFDLQLNLPSYIFKLSENFDETLDFDTVEVDLSGFRVEHPIPYIRMGNLVFRSDPPISNQLTEDTNSSNMDESTALIEL